MKYFIDYVQETSPAVWWYDGERITFRSPSTSVMLHAMRYDGEVTLKSLAEKAGINISAVTAQITHLTEKGFIRRDDEGNWLVMICPSVEQ